jgi:hypothetical protein
LVRVYLNDGNLFTGDPEYVNSDTSFLDRIASFTRDKHKQRPADIPLADAKFRDDVSRLLVEAGRYTR